MGSLQEELLKQMERLALIHPAPKPEAPLSLAEQRKLAGIPEATADDDASVSEKGEETP
jgi:hypothetical protein